jgi:osmotically-inducible protein OsmY
MTQFHHMTTLCLVILLVSLLGCSAYKHADQSGYFAMSPENSASIVTVRKALITEPSLSQITVKTSPDSLHLGGVVSSAPELYRTTEMAHHISGVYIYQEGQKL